MTDRNLLNALLKIERTLNKLTNACVLKWHAENNQDKPSGVPFMSVPPAAENYYAAENSDRPSKNRRENAHLVISAIGLIGVLFAAGFGYWTLTETHKQVEIMQKQLEATDRPWIKITSIIPESPLVFYNGSDLNTLGEKAIHAGFVMTIKNIGRSVAVSMFVKARFVFPDMSEGDRGVFKFPVSQQKVICSDPTIPPITFNLFPDEDSGNTLTIQDNPPIPRIGDGTFLLADKKRVMPALVGCILYKIVSTGAYHETGFIYQIEDNVPGYNHPAGILTVGKNVPLDRVVLKPYAFGGFDAN